VVATQDVDDELLSRTLRFKLAIKAEAGVDNWIMKPLNVAESGWLPFLA
jgi:hypothetical protein